MTIDAWAIEDISVGRSRYQLSDSQKKKKAKKEDFQADGLFYYEANQESGELSKSTSEFKGQEIIKNRLALMQVQATYNVATTSNTYKDQIAFLKQAQSGLSREQKLLMLSMYGSRLADNYDVSIAENRSLESIFQSVRLNNGKAGICGDIHYYLSEVASALGFDQVGIHSGLLERNLASQDPSGHALAHFRDPVSGEFYIANYSYIYATGQKSLLNAIDISTKWLGPLTDVSFIQEGSGAIHKYVPRTARWVEGVLARGSKTGNSEASLEAEISNKEQSFAIGVGDSSKTSAYKAFLLHSDINTNEGMYGVNAAGMSVDYNWNNGKKTGWISDFGTEAHAHGGFLQVTAPLADFSGEPGGQGEHLSLFVDSSISGFARIDHHTGRLEFHNVNLDLVSLKDSSSIGYLRNMDLETSVEHRWADLPLTSKVGRSFELLPEHVGYDVSGQLRVARDTLGIVFDTSGANPNRAYMVVGTHLYLLEGVENMSAVAVEHAVRLSVPTDRVGTFSVGYNIAEYLQNRSHDPFYDQERGQRVSMDWHRQLRGPSSVGLNVSAYQGTQIFPFSISDDVYSPEASFIDRLKAAIYFRLKF